MSRGRPDAMGALGDRNVACGRCRRASGHGGPTSSSDRSHYWASAETVRWDATIREMAAEMGDPRPATVHIRPRHGWVSLDVQELWSYRELLYFFVWRDLKVRYKQTAFGALWAIIQPFMLMVVFTLFLGGSTGSRPTASRIRCSPIRPSCHGRSSPRASSDRLTASLAHRTSCRRSTSRDCCCRRPRSARTCSISRSRWSCCSC